MEIVEINYMGQRIIKTCRWLVLDHDHMPIATHQTLEEIEAREAENSIRRNLSLIVNRDNLTWELRMNSRSFFAGKLVGIGELTRSAVDLGESTVNICRGNLRRNSNPSVVLDGVDHGLTAGMTEKIVQPELSNR
jgi:hypothetical protein